MKIYFSAFLLSLVASSNAVNLRANKRILSDIATHVAHLQDLTKCTLFQMSTELSNDKMKIDNRSAVYGDICIGNEGELYIKEDSVIYGKAFHGESVKFDPETDDDIFSQLVTGNAPGPENLSNEHLLVSDVSTKLADPYCTETNTAKEYKRDGDETIKLSPSDITVMCFTDDVEFKDGVFQFEGSGTLIMNIEGKLTIDNAKILSPSSNIIFNLVGDNDVNLKGNCKDGVCFTDVEATILAKKKIEISDSTFIGYAYTPGEMVVKDDSIVTADRSLIPVEPTPEEPSASPTVSPTVSPTTAPSKAPVQDPGMIKDAGPTSVGVCPNSYTGLNIEGCSVLQASDSMENGKVEIRDKMATVHGDVCVGLSGELKMDDDETYEEYVYGTVRLEGKAQDILYNDLEDIELRSHYLVKENDSTIHDKKEAAALKSIELEEEECTEENTMKEWKSETTTIQVSGTTVMCIQEDMVFKDKLFTIEGNGELILNIGKKLEISDATIQAIGDMSANNIVFNMMSTNDDDVKVEKGSVVDGTILGMNRKIEVMESRINGQLISNQDMKVKYGSMVVCDNADVSDGDFPVRTAE